MPHCCTLNLTLTLTLTFDLSTPKPCHSCHYQDSPRSFSIPSLNTFGHSFLSCAPNVNVKNALIDFVTMTFDLSIPNHVTCRISQGHPYTSLNTLGSFVSEYAADKQTDSKILNTPTDIVDVGN